MNILVTGAAGYIGSHVVKELIKRGHSVTAIDNLSKGHRAALPSGIVVEGDVADVGLLDAILSGHRIDGVIHLAADSLVGESMVSPAKYFDNNVVNGLRLLDSMLRHNVKKLVFSSSAAVYGEPTETPISEEHQTRPTNAYGETKLAFERILRWYDHAYGVKSVSLRYFNAAGADDSGEIGEDHHPETHLIPLVLLAAMHHGEVVKVFGDDYATPDGTAIRDYIHVTDLADAHILALEHLCSGAASRTYNLGSENGYSVVEIIEKARSITGREIAVETAGRRAGDPAILVASSSCIRRELGWYPKHSSLDTIISTAWSWHKQHPFGYCSR